MSLPQVVAFDVDGTLINEADRPRYRVIQLLLALHALDFEIWVWSGGGKDYAQHWVDRLGLGPYVSRVEAKDPRLPVDIAVDDVLDCDLGHYATVWV